MNNMQRTIRINFATDKVKRTGAGGLQLRGAIMKIGSFPYWYGTEEVLEDIPAEELFRPETIESARNIPLTNDHPDVMVDPENW